ncbi:hypothetical protein B23_0264 [Geobacillus thermoleovorans B23]|nr:hypothetical protein B23_0264 [Geobacillus thermoleovorans B23]
MAKNIEKCAFSPFIRQHQNVQTIIFIKPIA